MDDWKARVDQDEADARRDFLSARVAWVVAADTEKMISKSQGLSVVNEKKRKLFWTDYATSRPLDWASLKKRRRSSTERPLSCSFDYEQFFQVYSKIRTEDADKKSNDIIVALTPAPGLENCDNRPLKSLLQTIRGLIPKHSKPQIGEVERQLKKRGALANVVKDCITVVSEAKTVIEPGPMQHLQGGDTSYHKWPVPDIAWQHVATIKQEEAHRLFPSEADPATLEEGDGEADNHQNEADQALEKDGLVIPYPHEKHHLFAMELLNTFSRTDVVMIFSVASGEVVKAVILKHKYAVCFVPTLRAKEFAYARLFDWLKDSNIMPKRPPIPKPEGVLMWEKDHAQGQPNVPKTPPPTQPIVPKNLSPPPGAPSTTLPPPSPNTPVVKADTTKAVVTPKLPGLVVPKIAQFGSNLL